MTKRNKVGIAVFILTVALFYLMCAFTTWEFNPKNWETETRGVVAVFGILFGIFFAALTQILERSF
jgi:Mn2+/Fe2+ NRAMP family transporter